MMPAQQWEPPCISIASQVDIQGFLGLLDANSLVEEWIPGAATVSGHFPTERTRMDEGIGNRPQLSFDNRPRMLQSLSLKDDYPKLLYSSCVNTLSCLTLVWESVRSAAAAWPQQYDQCNAQKPVFTHSPAFSQDTDLVACLTVNIWMCKATVQIKTCIYRVPWAPKEFRSAAQRVVTSSIPKQRCFLLPLGKPRYPAVVWRSPLQCWIASSCSVEGNRRHWHCFERLGVAWRKNRELKWI